MYEITNKKSFLNVVFALIYKYVDFFFKLNKNLTMSSIGNQKKNWLKTIVSGQKYTKARVFHNVLIYGRNVKK